MPAGQGKSTIHAALTFLFLKNTDHDIHVVFNDNGLKKKDEDLNQNFIRLCEKAGLDYKKRVKYQTDLKRKKETQKKSVMIIDESHARMFKDLYAFHKATETD